MNFIKMHGLGNDFIIMHTNELRKLKDVNQAIIAISDRNYGVGCDQFIHYSKITSNVYKMNIYNPDGLMAAACGNATRCLAQFLYDQTNNKHFEFIIQSRKISAEVITDNLNSTLTRYYKHLEHESSNKSVNIFAKTPKIVSVNMGNAVVHPDWSPTYTQINQLCSEYNLEYQDIICVDIGNKHLICFSETLTMADYKILGPKLRQNKYFPDGINVNFAKIDKNQITLRVFERGVGFTKACGSGACATFAAALHRGYVETTAYVEFESGSLLLEMKDNNEVIMTGPTVKVCSGILYI